MNIRSIKIRLSLYWSKKMCFMMPVFMFSLTAFSVDLFILSGTVLYKDVKYKVIFS